MGLKDRTRRLEKRAGLDKAGPCAECGGRIVFAEHRSDGTVDYPSGGRVRRARTGRPTGA
ncbi:MAG: hypothetical protein M3Q60_18835 [Actinomycetota bacterium]|nr:hypothetical protein [Actinomycetota bacterium]